MQKRQKKLKVRERRVPITVMLAPDALENLDLWAKRLKTSRGKLLDMMIRLAGSNLLKETTIQRQLAGPNYVQPTFGNQ